MTMLYAHFNLTEGQVLMILSPFLLFLVSIVVLLTLRFTRFSVAAWLVNTAGVTLMFLHGDPSLFRAKVPENAFEQMWFLTAWFDLFLIILISVWLLIKLKQYRRRERNALTISDHGD